MNYLAHFYFCHQSPEHIAGSLLGDFVKGRDWQHYAESVQKAILFHRQIDSLTDQHEIIKKSRQRLPADFRRYSGIMLDMYYDHFLAQHWESYHHQPLQIFTQMVYQALEQQIDIMPEPARYTVEHMIRHDWLGSYQQPNGLQRAFDGLSRRLRRSNPLSESVHILHQHYTDLEQDFIHFMTDTAQQLINSGQ